MLSHDDTATTVPSELDHLFVMTAPGAPAADSLVEAGITEGTPRSHPGQGTTNRRFFFENVMFEFLWMDDSVELDRPLVEPTHLVERWQRHDTGGSPFGLCFRPAPPSDGTPPFTAWDYDPPYLPADRSIQIADNAARIDEPFLFFLPWATPPNDPPNHRAGLRTLTDLTILAPRERPASDALRTVEGLVNFETGERQRLILVFDDGRQGKTIDLRPSSPVTIRY
jgi:hypothetical protein